LELAPLLRSRRWLLIIRFSHLLSARPKTVPSSYISCLPRSTSVVVRTKPSRLSRWHRCLLGRRRHRTWLCLCQNQSLPIFLGSFHARYLTPRVGFHRRLWPRLL